MKKAAVAALFTLSAWSCTLTDAQVGHDGDSSPETAVYLGETAEWTDTTTSGIEVTVHPDGVPVRVGVIEFQISFEQELPDNIPVSVDVISPEMPVMGLMRYIAGWVIDLMGQAVLELGDRGSGWSGSVRALVRQGLLQ
jgi:hypothetical protein